MQSCVSLLLLSLVGAATAFSISLPNLRPVLKHAEQSAKAAAIAGLCSASLIAAPMPMIAAPQPTVNEAIVEFTEALYPILAIQNTALPPLTEQVGALIFNSIEPAKLATSIDLGLDALSSVPAEKIGAFNAVLKESFTGLTPDTGCNVVPLPPKSLVTNIAETEAFKSVDKAKLSKCT